MSVEDSPFDSGHYGIKVGRLSRIAVDSLDADLRAARGRYDVLFARVAEDDHAANEALAQLGALRLETLVTLSLVSSTPPATPRRGEVTRHERIEDAAEIERIAAITADAIGGSHLHLDSRLPLVGTRALYAAWARNDVSGRADQTFVARRDGHIDGYITVLVRAGTAIIDLFAVDVVRHGMGTGSALLGAFVDWIRANSLQARVGTQATNPALALYGRFGFEPATREATYHVWLEP